MRKDWKELPIKARWFGNIDESALTRSQAALENAFINEAGGHTRLPGLRTFATLADKGRVYLHEWREDLYAATAGGRLYRLDRQMRVSDVTGVPVSGGGRVTFAESDDYLLMAAGGSIIQFDGKTTAVLSDEAPETTHIAYIDSFILAIERDTQRFWHCEQSKPKVWNDADVFSADSSPDVLVAMLVTPFREVMLAGEDSVEQFERLATGEVPFFRRWGIGEGVYAPHTMCFADNGCWALNKAREFVKWSGQLSQPQSEDIGQTLIGVEDWTDAWAAPVQLLGQRFVLLQIPRARTPYEGVLGLTLLYDMRQTQWTTLYGWDTEGGRPARWPGWSVCEVWGRTFVGGEGVVYEAPKGHHSYDGVPQRMLCRTARYTDFCPARIDDMRVTIRRGTGSYAGAAEFRIRARRNGRQWGRWVTRSLGKSGETDAVVHFGGFGAADSFQFEWEVTDDVPVDVLKIEVLTSGLQR